MPNSGANIVYPVKGRRLESILYREDAGPLLYLLFPLLWLLSVLYRLAVKLRVFLYERGVFRSAGLDAYTLSVGNLTVGGTGKTPFVERLAGDLSRGGGAVAVLSRGYRRRRSCGPSRVPYSAARSGGLAEVRMAGDEPAMLARRLPDVPVIVDVMRSRGGEFAVSRCGARVLVLDDGFSHLALKRDCDILLVDGERGFGPERVLPLGPLREPPGQMARADHVLIVGGDGESRRRLAESLRKDHGLASIMEAVCEPSALVSLLDPADTRPPDLLRGAKCVAFSGLASPAPFEASLERLGARLLCSFRFPDHHWYDLDDFGMVTARARGLGADLIVTTEKDSVKVPCPDSSIPVYYLRIEVRIVSGENIYESILHKALEESTMTKPESRMTNE